MKIYIPALWILAFLCLMVAPAWAQSEGHADPRLLIELYNAVVNGQLGWLSGLAMIAAIEPAKRLLRGHITFFDTKVGGTALAFLMAAATGAAHALLVDAEWSTDLLSAIVRNAIVAIGGYSALKKTLVARFPWLEKIVGGTSLTPVAIPSKPLLAGTDKP